MSNAPHSIFPKSLIREALRQLATQLMIELAKYLSKFKLFTQWSLLASRIDELVIEDNRLYRE